MALEFSTETVNFPTGYGTVSGTTSFGSTVTNAAVSLVGFDLSYEDGSPHYFQYDSIILKSSFNGNSVDYSVSMMVGKASTLPLQWHTNLASTVGESNAILGPIFEFDPQQHTSTERTAYSIH